MIISEKIQITKILDMIDEIIEIKEDDELFDLSFVLSIQDQIHLKDYITVKQAKGVYRIYNSFVGIMFFPFNEEGQEEEEYYKYNNNSYYDHMFEYVLSGIENDNSYKILGLAEGASLENVKKLHKTLIQIYHPDHGGNEEHFRKIQKAYEQIVNKQGVNK